MSVPSIPCLKVFITSCETDEGAWRIHEVKLRNFHGLSDGRHELVDNPDEADLILIGNVREQDGGKRVIGNPCLRKWPDKCFSLSDEDHPLPVNRGIYASAWRTPFAFGRMRTGAYTAYLDDFQNPYVTGFCREAREKPEPRYLFSFVGRQSHACRKKILESVFHRSDVFIKDSTEFDLWNCGENKDLKASYQKHYFEIMIGSKFVLCPRGAGRGSLRLFESMMMGIAPVIISDGWVFPKGPEWNSFSLIVSEKNIDRLEDIISAREHEYAEMGRRAVLAYETYFSEKSYFNYIVWNCFEMLGNQRIPERFFVRAFPMAHQTRLILSRIKRLPLRNQLEPRRPAS